MLAPLLLLALLLLLAPLLLLMLLLQPLLLPCTSNQARSCAGSELRLWRQASRAELRGSQVRVLVLMAV